MLHRLCGVRGPGLAFRACYAADLPSATISPCRMRRRLQSTAHRPRRCSNGRIPSPDPARCAAKSLTLRARGLPVTPRMFLQQRRDCVLRDAAPPQACARSAFRCGRLCRRFWIATVARWAQCGAGSRAWCAYRLRSFQRLCMERKAKRGGWSYVTAFCPFAGQVYPGETLIVAAWRPPAGNPGVICFSTVVADRGNAPAITGGEVRLVGGGGAANCGGGRLVSTSMPRL